MAFFDTHCHVAFMAHPAACVRDACAHGSALAAVSVTPQEFHEFQQLHVMCCRDARSVIAESTIRSATKRALENTLEVKAAAQDETDDTAQEQGSSFLNTLYCGLGLHPWWVPSNAPDLARALDQFDALLEEADFIGEVGLDFSTRWVTTRAWQIKALEHIMYQWRECLLPVSLHCVRAYDDLLVLLRKTSGLSTGPIMFHWFSGTSDQLQQALKLGCYFSVSQRMLATKRGRAYVQAIPLNRLLLETDAPDVSWDFTARAPRESISETLQEFTSPCIPYSYAQLAALLKETGEALAQLRSLDPRVMEETLMANARDVFDGARCL